MNYLISIYWVFLSLLPITNNTLNPGHPTGIEMQVPFTSGVVTINSKPFTSYELHITNFSIHALEIDKIEVIDISDSSLLFKSEKKNLNVRFSEMGFDRDNDQYFLLPSSKGIVYLEFEVPLGKDLNLMHQISFVMNGNSFSSIGANVEISSENNTILLGSPLKGGPWVAIYDYLWPRGHRRVFYTVDGKARIPGRYAIDFIKLDKKGKTSNGDSNFVTNWYAFDADVLAVADGVVKSIRTDFEDSEKLDEHPIYNSLEATGNYISLKIDDGKYAFYEHLKSGSIQVRPGQIVKKGEVIASVGFTGQATAPHLHFHVADRDSPLGAEGIPFAFEEFTVLGNYYDFEKFGKEPWRKSDLSQSVFKKERPASNYVILFEN